MSEPGQTENLSKVPLPEGYEPVMFQPDGEVAFLWAGDQLLGTIGQFDHYAGSEAPGDVGKVECYPHMGVRREVAKRQGD